MLKSDINVWLTKKKRLLILLEKVIQISFKFLLSTYVFILSMQIVSLTKNEYNSKKFFGIRKIYFWTMDLHSNKFEKKGNNL